MFGILFLWVCGWDFKRRMRGDGWRLVEPARNKVFEAEAGTRRGVGKAIPKLRCSIPRRSLAARMLDLAGGVAGSQESWARGDVQMLQRCRLVS
jgi:hypothetical protein